VRGADEPVCGAAHLTLPNLRWGSPCSSTGKKDASIAISDVNDASLRPGPAITLANQVFGSGMNWTAKLRPALGLLSRPTSHAETGETNIPSAAPA
jgi:hypothetical protein